MSEIIFLVNEPPEGGYAAEALGQAIFTVADSLEELKPAETRPRYSACLAIRSR